MPCRSFTLLYYHKLRVGQIVSGKRLGKNIVSLHMLVKLLILVETKGKGKKSAYQCSASLFHPVSHIPISVSRRKQDPW